MKNSYTLECFTEGCFINWQSFAVVKNAEQFFGDGQGSCYINIDIGILIYSQPKANNYSLTQLAPLTQWIQNIEHFDVYRMNSQFEMPILQVRYYHLSFSDEEFETRKEINRCTQDPSTLLSSKLSLHWCLGFPMPVLFSKKKMLINAL